MSLFRRKDVADLLIEARLDQQKKDKKKYEEEKQIEIKKLKAEHELELQSRDAEIYMLEKEREEMKELVKSSENLSYKSKQQIYANVSIATQISMQMKFFSEAIEKIVGKIDGIKYNAETHHKELIK